MRIILVSVYFVYIFLVIVFKASLNLVVRVKSKNLQTWTIEIKLLFHLKINGIKILEVKLVVLI